MTRQIGSRAARAWVEIDLGAILRNATALAIRSGVPLLPMVKADAYGLGALKVVRALESLNPWGFGVATVEEGVELRTAGVEKPIIVFTPLLADEIDAAQTARLTPLLSREKEITRWGTLPWHLGIDTGMGRAGARWDDVARLKSLMQTHLPEGACTHFHSAELDDGSMQVQEERFEQALSTLGRRPTVLHVENGAAAARREHSRWTFIRPGVYLYGVGSGPTAAVEPEPVVSIRARVVDLRRVLPGESVSYDATFRVDQPRTVATLPIGYADGVRRALSNRGSAIVRGKRVPIAGIVTMDMIMLDVTDVPCEIGDVATLAGVDGLEEITIVEMAAAGELSPYEVLTGLRQRLPRIYLEAPQGANGAAQKSAVRSPQSL